MTPTLQQIDELKLSLDPSLKPLLSSEETGEINYSLWLQHQITKPEQRRAMLEATFFFVLGLITPQEFAGRIALLKEGEANQRALLNDIVRQRFVPYREAFLRTGRDLTVFENIAFPPITPTPPVPSNLAAPFPPPPQKTPVLTPLSLQKPEMPQSTIPRITISPTPPGRRPEPMPIPIQPIRYAPPPKSVEVPKVIKPIDNAQSLKSFDAAQDLRPFDTAQDLRPFDTAQGVKPINENEQAGQVKPARPAQEPLKSSEQVGQMNPEPKPAEQTRP
ncbi:MAG: hypothetical protein HYS57_01425, partial [Parcubacteria group bacterium]|nr:hypothetical protein [Parcubacteria group bacterium]